MVTMKNWAAHNLAFVDERSKCVTGFISGVPKAGATTPEEAIRLLVVDNCARDLPG
jgi:hypothetical protein